MGAARFLRTGVTPARGAGIVDHIWTMEEILEFGLTL